MRKIEYNGTTFRSNYSILLDSILLSIFNGKNEIHLMLSFDEFFNITYPQYINRRRFFTKNFLLDDEKNKI